MIPFLLETMMQLHTPYQTDDAAADIAEEKDCK